MRGQRRYRKLVTKLPSGAYRWSILSFGDNAIASGVEKHLMSARLVARQTELRLMNETIHRR